MEHKEAPERQEWSKRSKRYKVNYFAALGKLFGETKPTDEIQDQNTDRNTEKTES